MRLQPSLTLVFALLSFTSPVFAACDVSANMELTLVTAPGELAGARGALSVSVHSDGCVALELPEHRVDRGQYRLLLDAAELAQLRQNMEPLRNLSQAALDQSIAASAELRRANREVFEVHDADLSTLTAYDANVPRILRMAGLKQFAERYPENRELATLTRLIKQLDQLIISPRRERISVGATR